MFKAILFLIILVSTTIEQKEKTTHKIYVFGSKSCYNCGILEKKILTDSKVQNVLDSIDIIHMDRDKDSDREFGEKYGVVTIPEILLFEEKSGKTKFVSNWKPKNLSGDKEYQKNIKSLLKFLPKKVDKKHN